MLFTLHVHNFGFFMAGDFVISFFFFHWHRQVKFLVTLSPTSQRSSFLAPHLPKVGSLMRQSFLSSHYTVSNDDTAEFISLYTRHLTLQVLAIGAKRILLVNEPTFFAVRTTGFLYSRRGAQIHVKICTLGYPNLRGVYIFMTPVP